MLDCRKCLADKPEDQFIQVSLKHQKRGRHGWCNDCRRAYQRKANKEWIKQAPHLRAASKRKAVLKKYGLTPAQYAELSDKQGGVCAICGTIENFHVDHCHASGRVRGLLCAKCNRGIGHFNDDPGLLIKAIAYLERK